MGCLHNCIVGLSYIALQKLKEHLNSIMSAVLYVAKGSALMILNGDSLTAWEKYVEVPLIALQLTRCTHYSITAVILVMNTGRCRNDKASGCYVTT